MKPTLPLILLGLWLSLPARVSAQARPGFYDLLNNANNLLYSRETDGYNTLSVNDRALDLARQALLLPLSSLQQLSTARVNYLADLAPHIATEFVRESQIKASQNDWAGAMNARLDALELGVKMESSSRFADSAVIYADKIEAVAMKEIYPLASHLDAASSRALAARLDAIKLCDRLGLNFSKGTERSTCKP